MKLKIIEDLQYDLGKFLIHLEKCELVSLFHMIASIYCFDFPNGQISPTSSNGEKYEHYAVGIWDDEIDDWSISITRLKHREYELGFSSELKNFIVMKSGKTKTSVKIDATTLIKLGRKIRSILIGRLSTELVDGLKNNLLWNMLVAPTEDDAINLVEQGLYEF